MSSEFRFAARSLARWRGGLAVTVVTLAVAIGSTTSLYSLVRVLLPDLTGIPEPHRVARIFANSNALGVHRAPVALNEFDASLSRTSTFAAIGAYAETNVTIGTGADEQRITGGFATPGFFTAMGVPPLSGRVFSVADVGARQPVALISARLWRERFSNRELSSALISVNGTDRLVVGVMPPHFTNAFLDIDADVWIPLGRASMDAPLIVSIVGRLPDGGGWAAVTAQLNALAGKGQWQWRAIPLTEDAAQRSARLIAMALAPALIVLVLAAANVASMLLARGIARDRELTVRRALGASRARVTGHLLAEHALLALAGGTLGFLFAAVLLRSLTAPLAVVRPALSARLVLDWQLLPAALAASTLACLMFGALPALCLSRRNVAASLNGLPAARRLDIAGYGPRDLAVFVEVASAVALVAFAAMLFNLFNAIQRVTPAFAADRILAMRVPAHDVDAVVQSVAAIPGIDSVTSSSGMLGGRGGSPVVAHREDGRGTPMSRVPVGPGFFETLELELLRGRTFDSAESSGGPAAILSETAARALFPDEDAIGRQIQLVGHATERAVVIGISKDALDYGALSSAGLLSPDVYVPYDRAALEAVVLARAATDGHAFARAMSDAAPAHAGRVRAKAVVLADEPAFGDRADSMLTIRLLGGFAVAALLLAAAGIFSAARHATAQRTREFGIRLALGATPRGVLALAAAREAKLSGTALIVGALATFALTRALFPELARLSVNAPQVWIALIGLCGGTTALASLLALWRVGKLDLTAVLRRS